jgi:DNA (cytosine-5)-methyltransferase 1
MSNRGFVPVQEAAHVVGVSPDTIRRWEKKGLVKAHRGENNHRLFHIDELRRLQNKYLGASGGAKHRILQSSRKSRYKVIELFSGCGGLALGFENAGLQTELLVEIDRDAALSLQTHRPEWNVIHSDVAKIDFAEYRGKIDVVAGGFPCQAFSYAGQKRGFEDARGTLFYEFARCVSQVRPKIAIGENVRGLLKHDGGRTLARMKQILEELGYRVEQHLVRAQFHDVPQKRERLLIIAVRDDAKLPLFVPRECNYTISLSEALKKCPPSQGAKYPKRKEEIMKLIPEGGYWRNLPAKIQKEFMKGSLHLSGGKTGMARRLSWSEPSLTLTCSPSQKQTERCHPSETRPLTIREYARIQTFPDDWKLAGSVASQYRQIGNAVPVNLGYHIGRCIIAMLDEKPGSDMEEVVNTTRQLSLLV